MASGASTDLPIHRLDISAYDRVVASGALEGEHVELLHGLVVDMSPQSPAHAIVLETLVGHFAASGLRMRVQSPLHIGPDCEPEPDLALLTQRPPAGAHPSTALLAVEVAVSSQMIDRNVKANLYARAGIPNYWMVDVPGRRVETRTVPGADGYTQCEIYREGSVVPSPLEGLPNLDIATLLADVEADRPNST
jgi:Uma2 family endonuclease